MERKRGIIFDMDGVLVDAMPFHCEAIKTAARQEVDIDVEQRDVYLLEGMPGEDMVKQLLREKRYTGNIEEVSDDNSEELDSTLRCKKALVSGAAKQEVHSIINKYFGKDTFDVIVTGEDLEEGKPSPDPFRTALMKMGLRETEAIVVENAPLGVKAANNAGIRCIVTLNNTPLRISDFDGLIAHESIFPNTTSASSFLKEHCQSMP